MRAVNHLMMQNELGINNNVDRQKIFNILMPLFLVNFHYNKPRLSIERF